MIRLATKNFYAKFKFWLNLPYFIISFFATIAILYFQIKHIIVNENSTKIDLLLTVNMWIVTGTCCLTFIYILINMILKICVSKMLINETYTIIHRTKIPKILPKVVYVYTTHDDFMPARLLQNMQQSYENIEYWISDGSGKDETKQAIDKFVKQHKNVHLYRMDRPSENKADNLNSFLNFAKKNFNYLLIGDADVAFDKDFVKSSLPLFYSKNFTNLVFVSPVVSEYKTNNLYSNIFRIFDNITLSRIINEIINVEEYNELRSSCGLISMEYLANNNYKFPNSCLEDWYVSNDCMRYNFVGFANITVNATESFDKDYYASEKRLSRVAEWATKYTKEYTFKNVNDKNSKYFNRNFLSHMFFPFVVLFFILTTVLTITVYIKNFNDIIAKAHTLSAFILSFAILATIIILKLSEVWYFSGFKIMCLYATFFLFNIIIQLRIKTKSWWNAAVFSKYSTFVPSHSSHALNNKNIKIFICFLLWIIFTAMLATLIFLCIRYNGFNNLAIFYCYMLGFVLLFILSMTQFTVLFCQLISKIKSNPEYDKNRFVFSDFDYFRVKKVIKKIKKNQKYIELEDKNV